MNPRRTDDAREKRRAQLKIALFVPLTVFMLFDMIAFDTDSSALHIAVEGFITALGAVGILLLASESRHARAEVLLLRTDLERARLSAEQFRAENKELLSGLSRAIDQQFTRWGLTEAEREVGLLLLKGLSTKEVADVRGTSERTARQQATALYKKASLSGRAELSAFFLEDLMAGPSKG
jgi:DNA-binding CsgD family transcriptional regulator